MIDIPSILDSINFKPNPARDQYFLTDNSVLSQIVGFANLSKNDIVMEIGAGIGNLTRALAAKAGRVISYEIDPRFQPLLADLPPNVTLIFDDAWKHIQLHGKFRKSKPYNKIVANLPYSFAEKYLHNLTFLNYDKVILLVPQSFADKIESNGIFGSFFQVKQLLPVNRHLFYPVPRTNSVVIDLLKLPDPLLVRDFPRFLRQYVYQREDKLVKNSLMQGIIDYQYLTAKIQLTKNQSRTLIAATGIDQSLLNSLPGPEIYPLITEKFSNK